MDIVEMRYRDSVCRLAQKDQNYMCDHRWFETRQSVLGRSQKTSRTMLTCSHSLMGLLPLVARYQRYSKSGITALKHGIAVMVHDGEVQGLEAVPFHEYI